jgi:hypothetical protein
MTAYLFIMAMNLLLLSSCGKDKPKEEIKIETLQHQIDILPVCKIKPLPSDTIPLEDQQITNVIEELVEFDEDGCDANGYYPTVYLDPEEDGVDPEADNS